MAEHFPLARSTLSGHFAVLKGADLIVQERRGTTIVYSLNMAAVEELVAGVLELLGVGDQPATARGRRGGDEAELAE